jgi:hypothetical protein
MRISPLASRMSFIVPWAGALLVGCTPAPRYVSCSNGGECTEKDPRYAYCLQGRCVECVANGSCGDNRVCDHGQCVPKVAASSARSGSNGE